LQKKLPAELFAKVVWLDALPPSPTGGEGAQGFVGLILANEVLDAIPVHLIVNTAQGLHERGVGFDNGFIWQDKPLQKGKLHDEVSTYSLPNDYLTEFCPAAAGLMNSLVDCLKQGVILMIDYGFSAREYYHPQRNTGTLMCHFQHYAHDNPLINIGLQDITAHVNFTQIAHTADPHGIRLAGYVNQAQFLINCGILDILQRYSPETADYMKQTAAAQKLLSPAEMGELFKVIGFSKGFEEDLIGFKSGDKTHTL
jgi:SAM-dependent MidA family methyltransferase